MLGFRHLSNSSLSFIETVNNLLINILRYFKISRKLLIFESNGVMEVSDEHDQKVLSILKSFFWFLNFLIDVH